MIPPFAVSAKAELLVMEIVIIIKSMKMKHLSSIAALSILSGAMTQAHAAISLFEGQSNVDGTITNLTTSLSFDAVKGLGTISFTITGSGSHYVSLFVDHEIDESINTFFNEFGSFSGTPAAGQTWEIDEPGYLFGDIFTNFTAGSLDGSNGVDGVPPNLPDDVSMALGWGFTLAAGETALVNYTLSETAPTSGFYLTQTDPDSQKSLYFSSTNSIRGGGTSVPDGGSTLAMLGVSFALMGVALRRKLA